MILHGSYTSPYVRHCRIALAQSGLDWSLQETDYAGSAANSPLMRVPYLRDGEVQLTDSTSILMYISQKLGKPFIQTAEEMECYAMVNTAMDTAINLFLLERDGLSPDKSDYLTRQSERVLGALKALNTNVLSMQAPYNTSQTRLACFLDWGLFRKRFNMDDQPRLQAFLAEIRKWQPFADTVPS